MNIPNLNTENIFVFDNVADFAEAVTRFARGVNVFWKSGTTYDMLTSYVGGALVGAKYTVDASGASETPGGGGGGLLVHIATSDGETFTLDKTFGEIKSVMLSGGYVVLAAGGTGFTTLVPVKTLFDSASEKTIIAENGNQTMTFRASADSDYPSTGTGNGG